MAPIRLAGKEAGDRDRSVLEQALTKYRAARERDVERPRPYI